MQLSLAFCQAPRVAFNEKGAEEPYGWESREYLRKMLIGQVVKFKVLYKVDAISRSFASLEFKGKDVLRDVVEHGMVTVRSERDDKGQKELYESLLRLQSDARSAHRGIWGDKRVLRSVNWTLSDPESFFKANKGLPLVGIVEQVRDGSTFRLYLPDTHDMIMLHLAGVQSPRITYSAEGAGTFHGENDYCISNVRAAIAGIAAIFGASLAESQRCDFHRRNGQIQRFLIARSTHRAELLRPHRSPAGKHRYRAAEGGTRQAAGLVRKLPTRGNRRVSCRGACRQKRAASHLEGLGVCFPRF